MTDKISLYQGVPEPDRTIVRLLAVAYEPMAKSKIVACLKQLGVKTPRGTLYTQASIEEPLQALAKKKLIRGTHEFTLATPELTTHCLKETMAQGLFLPFSEVVQAALPVEERSWYGLLFRNYSRFLRHLRLVLFKATSWDEVDKVIAYGEGQFLADVESENPLVTLFNHPFDGDYLLRFPDFCHHELLTLLCHHARMTLTPADPVFAFLKQTAAGPTPNPDANFLLAFYLTLWGRHQEAEPFLAAIDDEFDGQRLGLTGWHQTLAGHDPQAIARFTEDHGRNLKLAGRKKEFFRHLSGVFFLVSLLRRGEPGDLAQAGELLALIKAIKNHPLHSYCPALLRGLNQVLGVGQEKQAKALLAQKSSENFYLSPFHALFHILADYWEDKAACRQKWTQKLTDLRTQARAGGQVWLTAEAAELLARLGVEAETNSALAASLRDQYQLASVINAVRLVEPWERDLKALITLAAGRGGAAGPGLGSGPSQRLTWWFSYNERFATCGLTPRLQSKGKSGKWSAGRPVALKKLAEEAAAMAGLTAQDQAVCAAIKVAYENKYNYSYYRHEVYRLEMESALTALAGHPLIFLEETDGVRIDLVGGDPELVVTRGKRGIKVTMQPPMPETASTFRVVKETPTRYKVVRFNGQHQAIAAILQRGLTAPGQAERLTSEAIAALSSLITIHSDLEGAASDSREVEADPQPHLHLIPYQQGLKAEILVRPLPAAEAWYQPGAGGQRVFAEVGGEKLHAARDLKGEKELTTRLLAACPTLERQESHNGEYLIPSPEECLEVLLEVREAGELVTVQWPQGESLRVRGRAGASSLSLKINREREWFKASGQVTLDDTGVIALQKLLALLDQGKGRFVQLDDGSFLALTEEFRNRLEELRAYGERHGDGVRFSPLAAFALEELTEEAGEVKVDRHWQHHLDHLNEVITPEVPSTLQAELRDYQVTGFRWLAQLAHWGVGACLADDMGLGKTVQALAALLRLAPEGPTLVVAPLSVLMNWQEEASRFAPTLNPIPFGPGDRRQTLLDLQPFDLVICSYGLLQMEAELLSEVKWQTIVLDEAQAIKNMNTKRAKAAMGLNGRFKVITTGTPVENHLGELWSLFDFINPGLLGSFQRFSSTFMTQVNPESDQRTRARLRKLIQPFILRRLKSDVLKELPARTEITMRVTMNTEEAALYEAQRRLAVERLAEAGGAPQGQQQIKIFAEIMRLRRLCCNPELVLPGCGIEGAKLKVFGDLVEEILDNRHKALVFSQFVDHLSILSRFLDERGIAYQYLDGSTPVATRKKRITAFQAGEGDLFLISLKAGGSGLNLTAADYVIHMDPWWNPAVEDQASDRAHRIGQQRPVTIYRLVMADSIEEQIIKLHQEKRDLADSLLAGGDLSGKLSAAELLNLLKEARE